MDRHSPLPFPSGYGQISAPLRAFGAPTFLPFALWGWHFIFPTLPEQVGSECRYDAPPDSGLQVCDPQAEYLPRDPAASVLYGVVSEQLETFLDRQRCRERSVPRFVERELRSFPDFGVPAHGFLRVHCDACGRERPVAFSNMTETILNTSASAKHHGFCACLTFAQVEVGIPICTPAFAISANVVSDTVKSSSSIM